MTLPNRVKRGDTALLTGTCGDEAGPVDISGADTVTLTLRSQRTREAEPFLQKLVENLDTGTANRGRWSYRCAPTDLHTSGTYGLTVTVHWPDGTQYTFPSQGAEELTVENW